MATFRLGTVATAIATPATAAKPRSSIVFFLAGPGPTGFSAPSELDTVEAADEPLDPVPPAVVLESVVVLLLELPPALLEEDEPPAPSLAADSLSTLPAVDSEEEVPLDVLVPDPDDESVVGGFFGGGCGFFTGTVVLATSGASEKEKGSMHETWLLRPTNRILIKIRHSISIRLRQLTCS